MSSGKKHSNKSVGSDSMHLGVAPHNICVWLLDLPFFKNNYINIIGGCAEFYQYVNMLKIGVCVYIYMYS